MKRIALALVLPAMMWGQAYVTQAPPQQSRTKLIHVHYAVPSAIAELLRPEGFNITAQNGLHAVVIEGNSETVTEAEQLIKDLDQPSPSDTARATDVEVTVYLIGATMSPENPHTLPGDLSGVDKQLRAIFPYRDYRLLDMALLASRVGGASSTSGFMPDFPTPDPSRKSHYSIGYVITPDPSAQSPAVIKFHEFTFDVSLPWGPLRFQTDVDLPEGQKVVVGKTTVNNDDSAIFLVLSAKELR